MYGLGVCSRVSFLPTGIQHIHPVRSVRADYSSDIERHKLCGHKLRDMERIHRKAVSRRSQGNAMTVTRTGYEKKNIHKPANQTN